MKKRHGWISLILIIMFFVAFSHGQDKIPSQTQRVTKMRAGGVVTELTDEYIKIKRQVKGSEEIVEFLLEKPLEKIKVGDKVKVSYLIRDDKKVAIKVTKDLPPKATKTTKKKEIILPVTK